jgi:putative flavoprotein involved in K+ transport
MAFAPDLAANIAHGDAAYHAFIDQADAHVRLHGLDLPEEPSARLLPPDPGCLTHPLLRLDLRAAGIGSVVWATGYRYDLDWVCCPVMDAAGAPVHRDGVTGVPGLYFLGLHFLSTMGSALLSGVGADAARLADHILARS